MAAARSTFAALLVLFCAVSFAPAAVPAGGRITTPTALESGVLEQLNAIRAQHRLPPLHLNARLAAAAAQHTREMGVDGYFRHESADGSAFWKRIARYYPSGSSGYWSVGENLLWSSPSVGPARAMDLWMHSPEHRANILSPRWREIGVAAVHFASAPGSYKGLPVTIVTTDFGVRG